MGENREPARGRAGALALGLFGLVGCLAAWPLGEALFALAGPSGATTVAPDGAKPDSAPVTAAPSTGPPPPPDIAPRLAAAGAQSGGVQVVLAWDDPNDLDLHVVGPDGHEIYTATRDVPSPSGGRLDVDANTACHASTPTPVENVVWPAGRAPTGTYRVFVDAYERCPSGPDLTRFRVHVLADGKWEQSEGTAVFSERRGKQLVRTFEVRTAPDATPPPATTPATAESPSAAPAATPPHPVLVRRVWFALAAVAFLLALSAGPRWRTSTRPILDRAAGLLAGGGAAVGLALGEAGRILDGGLHASGGPGVGFGLALVLLGVILALAVSLPPPRVDLKKAVGFGAAAGLVAVAAYFLGGSQGDWLGRLLALAALGFGVGFAAGVTPLAGAVPASPAPAIPAPSPAAPRPTLPPPVPPARPAPPVPPVAKPTPPVPKPAPPAPPPAPKPPPAPPKPPAPAPPTAKPPAPAAPTKPVDPDACPYCRNGTKHPGTRGNRYCIVYGQTY